MALIKKLEHGANTIYPATIPQAVVDHVSGKSVRTELDEKATSAELDQLAGDVKEVKVKDAEQDASIKTIEQLISQSNLNQTAQVSSTGREIVSLPKTASNGGMDVKMEGLTATNLVVNGDFRNGLTGWDVSNVSNAIVFNNEMTFTPNSQGGGIFKSQEVILGHKIYVSSLVKATTQAGLDAYDGTSDNYKVHSGSGNFERLSVIIIGAATVGTIYAFQIKGLSTVLAPITIKNNLYIDLTAIFGSGNEPDLATCDAMFSTYFEGTKSMVSTGRARSVGKNLLPFQIPELKKINDGVIGINYYSTTLPVIPNIDYILQVSVSKAIGSGYFIFLRGQTDAYSDLNTIGIRSCTAKSKLDGTITIGVYKWTNEYDVGLLSNLMLSQGTTAKTYEPYRSTNLYLTAPELRSLPNGVRDEIRKGENGYEVVKRVSEFHTIASSDVTVFKTWGSTNNFAGISVALFNNLFDPDAGSGQIYANGFRHVQVDSYSPDATVVNDIIYAEVYESDSIKFVIPRTVDTIEKAQTYLNGVKLIYQLATPVITPIEHAGILNSAESGTVYHEPVVADAGVYGTNLPILNTDYPISTIEEIIKHEGGIGTYLNVATAVIAPDGLSFTHPDLTDGDLVLFTYAFAKEKVNGLLTATYYDGRYVIADSTNGKFYKWKVASTNGVPSIALTEV